MLMTPSGLVGGGRRRAAEVNRQIAAVEDVDGALIVEVRRADRDGLTADVGRDRPLVDDRRRADDDQSLSDDPQAALDRQVRAQRRTPAITAQQFRFCDLSFPLTMYHFWAVRVGAHTRKNGQMGH